MKMKVQAFNTSSSWLAVLLVLVIGKNTAFYIIGISNGILRFLKWWRKKKFSENLCKICYNKLIVLCILVTSSLSLNQNQIAFVHKIINHIEQNGYMEDIKELMKPPFDKPVSFVKLFDMRTRTSLMKKINEIKENAVNVVA